MTNPPYATGPASEPNPQQTGPASPSFEYRPHDPYGTFQPGEPAGPVLPPAPTFAQRWGFVPMEGRLSQVTWMLRLLWAYLAAGVVLMSISLSISVAIASFFNSGVGLVLNILSSLLVAAVALVLIWGIARERLGRFGFQDPKTGLYIGLGFLGLVSLCGFIGAFKVPFAIVQLVAVLGVLGLLYTKPVGNWLRDTPGNQSAKAPEQRPAADDQLFPGYQPPPPQWRDAAPRPNAAPPNQPGPYTPPVQQPPAPGSSASQGWPQPPQ
ncbi:hypothetical protein [Glycomyces sp. NPDC048151]|uniref:hypothetical protein n=1 Tax=Glycomyces sp. NPDC048151 TaxID=3364002 RepID=UPI003718ACF9